MIIQCGWGGGNRASYESIPKLMKKPLLKGLKIIDSKNSKIVTFNFAIIESLYDNKTFKVFQVLVSSRIIK